MILELKANHKSNQTCIINLKVLIRFDTPNRPYLIQELKSCWRQYFFELQYYDSHLPSIYRRFNSIQYGFISTILKSVQLLS